MENPQNFIGFCNYSGLVFARVFRKFPFWWDMFLGTVASILTFALQVRWGLIPLRDWQGHKLHWVLSFTLPYVILLTGHLIWRFTTAPWRVYQDQEQVCRGINAQTAVLETNVSALKKDLEKALAFPEGPEIVLEESARNHFRVRNLKGGTAYNVMVHSFTHG